MSKQVVIVGGGVIGLSCAYYLHKAGHAVTVIDQGKMNSGASYVNAGYLSPSHIIPLAAPGVMKKGLKWMFDASSPLFIKPQVRFDFLKWVWAFNRSCHPKHVANGVKAIKEIALLSQELHDELRASEHFTFHLQKEGLLMLCQTQRQLEEEIRVMEMAIEEDLTARYVAVDDLRQMQPEVQVNSVGATYYQCDWHSTPGEFMTEMKRFLTTSGVAIRTEERVVDLHVQNHTITSLETTKQTYKADDFVLAAGSWSKTLSKKVGLPLLLEAGKGYRINHKLPTGITIPAILAERKVAVTPMNGFTRFAGTMEIAGINQKINKVRVQAIADAVRQYYPEIVISEEEKKNAACGLRPVSPNGLPYIGKTSKCNNLAIATGHAMMGWSMAAATGKLIQETIDSAKLSMDIGLFSPDRRF